MTSSPRPFQNRLRTLQTALTVLLAIGILSTGVFLAGHSSKPEPAGGLPTGWGQLALPAAPLGKPAEDLPFIAFGDSGSRAPAQYKIAQEMARQYLRQPFAFALMLGDNIYPDGEVKKYGEASFTRPYGPLLRAGVRFYASLGNHDVDSGHGDEQVAFFRMPARYYTFTRGNTAFFALDTNAFDDVQRQWLLHALRQSTARWKVVYGHHPVFSSGEHGSSPALQARLKPILEQQRADLYLSGHDHNYERFRPVNGVHYLVSGGAGAYLRKFKKVEKNSQLRLMRHHFLRLQAQGEVLTFTVLDETGQVLDQGRIQKAPALKQRPAV